MRLAGEMVTGMGMGLGLAVTTGVVAYGATRGRCESELCEVWVGLGAVAIGGVAYPVGAGLGVALGGNIGEYHGSLEAAIGGAYVGALTGALLGAMVSIRKDRGVGGAFVGYAVGASLGAVFGFHLSLQPDEPSTGLVNVSGNGARLSIPVVSMTQDPLHAQRTVTSMRLLDARF